MSTAFEKGFDYDSGVVDLSAEIEGDWDKVCLITPYFDNQLAEELMSYGQIWCTSIRRFSCLIAPLLVRRLGI